MPRRILLLITDLEIGGTPTVVRELAKRLREPRRVEVQVACLASWGPVADKLRAAGVMVTALGGKGTTDLPKILWRLVHLIRGERFDTVFSFLLHANAVAAGASAMFPGVRFLQSIQTTQPEPRWHWRLQRLIHPAAEAVVVPSRSAARAARAWAGVPRGKLVIIPNAVDVESFDAVFDRRREPKGALQVGFIGRLDPVKRVPMLVGAMPHLPGADLHIFGEGADRRRIDAEIERLGLRGRVTLHGAIARPHAALAMIDVLVLPSAAEGFGLVLIEAMAAGVPVVATDAPGIRDVVEPGRTGFLCSDRPIEIARAVLEANSSAWRNSGVPRARAAVREQYAWPRVLAQYRALLDIGG